MSILFFVFFLVELVVTMNRENGNKVLSGSYYLFDLKMDKFIFHLLFRIKKYS